MDPLVWALKSGVEGDSGGATYYIVILVAFVAFLWWGTR